MNKMTAIAVSVITLFVVSSMPAAAKNKCKCYSQPFTPEPPCVKHCITGLIAVASREDLARIFGLDPATSAAIENVMEKISSPDQELADLLSADQNKAVSEAFARIGNDRLRDFIDEKVKHLWSYDPYRRELIAELFGDGTDTNMVIVRKAGSDLPPPKVAPHKDNIQEALRRAKEARKVGNGKFLRRVVVTDDKVRFGFDAADVSPEAKSALDKLAAELKNEKKIVYIEIQGHTDNTGSEEYNKELGLIRADAVRRYLVKQYGLPEGLINIISYGSSVGVADNATREGRAKNRRVEVIVVGPS